MDGWCTKHLFLHAWNWPSSLAQTAHVRKCLQHISKIYDYQQHLQTSLDLGHFFFILLTVFTFSPTAAGCGDQVHHEWVHVRCEVKIQPEVSLSFQQCWECWRVTARLRDLQLELVSSKCICAPSSLIGPYLESSFLETQGRFDELTCLWCLPLFPSHTIKSSTF